MRAERRPWLVASPLGVMAATASRRSAWCPHIPSWIVLCRKSQIQMLQADTLQRMLTGAYARATSQPIISGSIVTRRERVE